MFRSDHKNPILRTIAHSKWALAALFVIGLIYFEIRIESRLTNKATDESNRPKSMTTTSLTQ